MKAQAVQLPSAACYWMTGVRSSSAHIITLKALYSLIFVFSATVSEYQTCLMVGSMMFTIVFVELLHHYMCKILFK